MTKELYTLHFSREERAYEGFALVDAPSLLGRENLRADISPPSRRAGVPVPQPPHLKEIWKAPKVTGKVSPKHDCPGINLIYPAFSSRACECLSEFFADSGELLPLDTQVGQYFFFNVTKYVDVVDHSRSVCTYLKSDNLRVVNIDQYAIHEQRLADAHIFRAYDLAINTFVSLEFLRKVQENELRGFRFTKIWPHPPGTKWRLTEEILT